LPSEVEPEMNSVQNKLEPVRKRNRNGEKYLKKITEDIKIRPACDGYNNMLVSERKD
jgi:hypothetical protein